MANCQILDYILYIHDIRENDELFHPSRSLTFNLCQKFEKSHKKIKSLHIKYNYSEVLEKETSLILLSIKYFKRDLKEVGKT